MPSHNLLDQATLVELWNLARAADAATQGHGIDHVYIRTRSNKGQMALDVCYEGGGLFTRFCNWLGRLFNKKYYIISQDSLTATLLNQLHNKTIDLDEATLVKAIESSTIQKESQTAYNALTKIKNCCRTINAILQRISEHKVENAIEPKQEGIKLFFTSLFLPSWGLTDIRKAEMQRAQEELRRAQETATNKLVKVVGKIQAYLDAATAQLNVAMTGKEEAEQLLQKAKNSPTQENLALNAAKAQESATAAEDAQNIASEIAKQADILVKAAENAPSQPILNFGEIEELKKFREIVNVAGEAAEYAQSARNAATEINRLVSKQKL